MWFSIGQFAAPRKGVVLALLRAAASGGHYPTGSTSHAEGDMGLIWDIIQHGQIQESRERASSLESRIDYLEQEVRRTNEALMTLLRALEQRFGEDLNRDGRVG